MNNNRKPRRKTKGKICVSDAVDAKVRKSITREEAVEELSKNNVGTSLFKEVYSVIKAVSGDNAISAEGLLCAAVRVEYVRFMENTLVHAGKIVITDLQGLCNMADGRVWAAFAYYGDTCPPTKRGFRIYEVEYEYSNQSKVTRFFTKEHYWQRPEARRKGAKIKATLLLVPHALPGE